MLNNIVREDHREDKVEVDMNLVCETVEKAEDKVKWNQKICGAEPTREEPKEKEILSFW